MLNEKIMIVEDEKIVAEDIRESVEKIGYTACAVVSMGEEAVKKAGELLPDLVLMDIMLKGGTDGIEAAGQINSLFNIPVVYLTAYADDYNLQRAKITEPYGYILKPFEERELHIAIEIALYKHRMEEDRKKLKEDLASSQQMIKTLSGMLPICAYCKKIRDDKGYWEDVASYITRHSKAIFTHGLCPECARKAKEEFENTKNGPG